MADVRILFLASNPLVAPLDLEDEVREIETQLRLSDNPSSFELIPKFAVRAGDLLRYFNRYKPHIVHFSGHGTQSEQLILLDDNGNPSAVSRKALTSLFSHVKDNIKVVVLNACWSKPQIKAITKVIDCGIGMQRAIPDRAAITFASYFYGALGFGRSVEEAFNQGKTALLLHGIAKEEIPVLAPRRGIVARAVRLLSPTSDVAAESDYATAALNVAARAGIKALIESVDIPMYFVDQDLVIQYANKPLSALLDIAMSAMEGKPIEECINQFISLAPPSRRDNLRKKQQLLTKRLKQEKTDHCEENDFLDHREMAGNRYEGLNRVWISADKVYIGSPKRCIGIFVVYHVEKVVDPVVLQGFPTGGVETAFCRTPPRKGRSIESKRNA